MNKLIPLLAALLAGMLALAAPGAAPDAASVERQMKGVSTLIESSSAARQIDASGKPEAIKLREQARALYARALLERQAGDLPAAQQLLNEASRALFEGVRLASPPEDKAKRQQAEFAARLGDARAMLDAHRRVVADKGGQADAQALVKKVEKLLADAEQAAPADAVRGLALVEQGYHLSRAAIGSLRAGETLVRSLNFANKEEEYRYEQDRHESHTLLVQLLLKEKRDVPGIDRMVQGFIDKAMHLRAEAEAKASVRDFGAAVTLMEEATRELVRAIRGAGVFIPG